MSLPGVAMRVLAFLPGAILLVPMELRQSLHVRKAYQDALYGEPPELVSSSDLDELLAQTEQYL